MENIKLSVIIPAYNESKRIGKTLESVDEYLKKQDYSYEIIVVENNSSDDTAGVVKKYQQTVVNLKLMELGEGINGKGGAVKEGLLKSTGQFAVFMDADNSTRLSEMDKFWPYFEEGYGVVIGSRDIEGAKLMVPQSAIKELFGKMGNLLIQIVLLPGIKDTQCGFKAFKRVTIGDIFPLQTIQGWGFDIEVLALAKRLGHKMKEVPISWFNEPGSKVSWKGYLEVFRDLFKVRFRFMTGKYKLPRK